jgi:acyl-CoA thioester hydrolase
MGSILFHISVKTMIQPELKCHTETRIRFSEVDSMGVVWHGNYIRYFEDGRESFGNKYGINYLDFHRENVIIPLVKINCDFKKPLFYGDSIIIETRFVNCEAAKLQYDYTIYRNGSNEVVATGTSVQVFLTPDMELMLDFPQFFKEWRKKHGFE